MVADSEQQYKTKLQIYAKRKNLGLPTYCVQREGAIHDLCFKATVSVGGESFKSPGVYKSAKEAEDAAARFALMSLTSAAFQEVKSLCHFTYLIFFMFSENYRGKDLISV